MATARQHIVVIGGVATGPKAAARARRRDPRAEITIIEKGRHISYAGCGMPYCVAQEISGDCYSLTHTAVGVPRDAAYFRNVKDINVLTQTLAVRIDRQAKQVETVNIETQEHRLIPYDKLVIATGSTPIVPPIEGMNLKRVIRLNELEDAINVCDLLGSCTLERAVIIGSGYIGLEMAEAFAKRHMHVTVVEMLPHVLPRVLDPEMATFLTRHLRAKGVVVRLNAQVSKIVGDDQGNVSGVVLANGETIPASLVLVAVGVRPNIKLAQEAGLKIGTTGAIAVNEYLQTSDPDIYAGGDCVENVELLTGKKIYVYVPLGSTANKHGRVIGDNVTGGHTTFPGILVTSVLRVFDYNVGKTGLNEREARANGFDVVTALNPSTDASHYLPTAKLVLMKMVADRATGRLLGVQAVGPGDGVKRVDVAATALTCGGDVKHIADIDLAYAPPYATAIDLIQHTANIIRNKMDGLAKSITPLEVKEKLDRGDDFVWLDVRSPAEYEQMRIEDPRIKLIPLGMLRRRLNELPRDKEIIAFCKLSLRGYEAQTILEGAGFTNVKFMDGGVVAWPYDVVTA